MAASHPEPDLFDQLRKDWKQQQHAPAMNTADIRKAAEQDNLTLHRRYLRAVLFVTASFLVAMSVTFFVFFRYDDHSLMFYGAILTMNLIMISMAVMMWMGVQREKNSFALSSIAHIEYTLRKLRFRLFTKIYAAPVYMILLLITLYCYYYDVLSRATPQFRFWAYSITTLYCVIVYFFSKRRAKPNLEMTKRLVSDLEKLRVELKTEDGEKKN